MKTIYVVVLGALCLLAAKDQDRTPGSNCNMPELTGVPATAIPEEYRSILVAAEAMVKNIIAAMNDGNYNRYIRDFSAAMKRGYTKEDFQKNTALIKEKIGSYVSGSFWKMERSSQNYILYYHATFSKAGEPVIIRLVLQKVEGLLRVAFLSLDSPALRDIGQQPLGSDGISGVATQ